MAEFVNREATRGADRARDLIDNMMKYVKRKLRMRDVLMERGENGMIV